MGDALKEEFQLRNIRLSYADLSAFVRSQWCRSQWFYPAWRAFWLVWHVVWIIVSGVRTQNTAPNDDDGYKWFIHLSNVTFLLTTGTCLVDFVLVILAACSSTDKASANSQQNSANNASSSSQSEKEEILFHGEFTLVEGMKIPTTPWYFQLLWMLYEAMNCANLLTTIVFWAVEYDGEVIHADVIVFNVINTIFVMANLMVADYPVRLLHVIYPALYTILYFLYNLIYYLSDGKDFDGSDVTFEGLDWDDALPTAVTIPVALLVAVPLGHLVFFTLYTLREYLASLRDESTPRREIATVREGQYRRRTSNGFVEDMPSGQGNRGFEMEIDNPSPPSY